MAPPKEPYSAVGLLVSTLNFCTESSGGVMLMNELIERLGVVNTIHQVVVARPG